MAHKPRHVGPVAAAKPIETDGYANRLHGSRSRSKFSIPVSAPAGAARLPIPQASRRVSARDVNVSGFPSPDKRPEFSNLFLTPLSGKPVPFAFSGRPRFSNHASLPSMEPGRMV